VGIVNNPQHEKRSWVQPYYATFDGIRAVAILSVFYYHYCHLAFFHLYGGMTWAGVDLFFVLSGFLITGILYDSRQRPKYFQGFYIRRSLRILPVCWGVLLAIVLLAPIFHLVYGRVFLLNFVFLQNLNTRWIPQYRIDSPLFNPTKVFVPFGQNGFNIDLGHLWSVCVEEQFYLIWPLIVWLIPTRRKLMTVAAMVGLGAIVLRCYLFATDRAMAQSSGYLYTSSLTRCDELLMGAWLALWLRGNEFSNHQISQISGWLLIAPPAVLFTAIMLVRSHFRYDNLNPVMQTIGYSLLGLTAAGFLLRSLHPETRLHRWLQHSWLRHLGRISYGFYIYNQLPLRLLTEFKRDHLRGALMSSLIFPIAFAFSYVTALLSFHFVESPFLKLKKLLAPTDPGSFPDGADAGITSPNERTIYGRSGHF
jgi:peptidoglycan/LPS O-acetylase OafA/YrhL